MPRAPSAKAAASASTAVGGGVAGKAKGAASKGAAKSATGAAAGSAAKGAAKAGAGAVAKSTGMDALSTAASAVADPNKSKGEKAQAAVAGAASVGVNAAVSTVATPLAGKVAGQVTGKLVGSKWGKYLLVAVIALVVINIVAVPVLITLAATSTVALLASGDDSDGEAVPVDYCTTTVPAAGDVSALSEEQMTNAAIIVSVVAGRDLSASDAVIAVMTAMQESSLTNLSGGDRDSAGLFQQRPSQGWGTLEQITDPKYATGKFLDHLTSPSLVTFWDLDDSRGDNGQHINNPDDPGDDATRASFEPWWVAQSIQRSGFPEAYEDNYAQAVAVVQAIVGSSANDLPVPWQSPGLSSPTSLTCDGSVGSAGTVPKSAVAFTAIEAAKGKQGALYVWGSQGPTTFDCSGLTSWAYAQAGVAITRTSRSEYQWGVANSATHPIADAEPGDLIFWSTNTSDASQIYHVAIWLGNETIVAATQPGSDVKVEPLWGKESGLLMPLVVRPSDTVADDQGATGDY